MANERLHPTFWQFLFQNIMLNTGEDFIHIILTCHVMSILRCGKFVVTLWEGGSAEVYQVPSQPPQH